MSLNFESCVVFYLTVMLADKVKLLKKNFIDPLDPPNKR